MTQNRDLNAPEVVQDGVHAQPYVLKLVASTYKGAKMPTAPEAWKGPSRNTSTAPEYKQGRKKRPRSEYTPIKVAKVLASNVKPGDVTFPMPMGTQGPTNEALQIMGIQYPTRQLPMSGRS